MSAPLVMTLLGADRPGLVEAVASAVAQNGGNWLESRMCHLAGRFAGILCVDIPDDRRQSLLDALGVLGEGGLRFVIDQGAAGSAAAAGAAVSLELIGNDRPGIVSQISGVLARHSVNVEDLYTECVSAPMSGAPLFVARAKLSLPDGCDLPALRRDLEHITAELMVDFTLVPT